jgi:hypothetical protein
MKKAASKRTANRKKKVGTLPARRASAGEVKGGWFAFSATSAAIDNVGKALATAAQKQ